MKVGCVGRFPARGSHSRGPRRALCVWARLFWLPGDADGTFSGGRGIHGMGGGGCGRRDW